MTKRRIGRSAIILCSVSVSVLLLVYHHPCLTLPYHTGKTFYRLALKPLTGPMRIPELTVRLQNPEVQY